MPLLAGDIQIARSAVMADHDNGGGPPSKELLPDGASNTIVPDISEDARVGGLVEIRHLHGVLRNTDVAQLGGANIILAEPPDDPYTSVTLVATGNTHARRPDIVRLIESTSTPGAEFGGFLLENHVTGQRSIQIAQRPGVEPPAVNTTLYLVQDEGKPTQREQYVRVRRVTVAQTTFTEVVGGSYQDYKQQVATCELFSPLAYDFVGTSANRLYQAGTDKTRVRRVNVMDAGSFFSASRLVQPCTSDDMEVKLESVYTQLVPNTRAETPLTDQRPGGQVSITLKDAVGTLEVTTACHTQRLMVSEATQGYAHTFTLRPLPAPGTVTVSYLVMGAWLTLNDDGNGSLMGAGGGTVNYLTGSVAVTLQALADYNSAIIISWADTAGYTNRSTQPVQMRQPEWCWQLDFEEASIPPHTIGQIAKGTLQLQWYAGGEIKTATDDGGGNLQGDADGYVDYALRTICLRPHVMPDSGGEVAITCERSASAAEYVPMPALDASGYAEFELERRPFPGTLTVQWATLEGTDGSEVLPRDVVKAERTEG